MGDEESDAAFKVRENRLRRMAKRQGLTLVKSRIRDQRAIGYGMWFVVDPSNNTLQTSEHGMNIDEVENYLNS